ncbi:MAG: hypothetical protein WCJ54_08905, partial [Actinomycetota bacterium]
SEVNDKKEPVKAVQEFNSGTTIYACVQMNFLIPGDKLLAKWYDASGAVLFENPLELKDSFYRTSWIAFSLESASDKPLPEGNYRVEIYLNDVKYNEFKFTITAAATVQAVSGITFDKGNIFTEAEAKYYFTISYPDNCEYSWQEDQNSVNVTFTPLDKNDGYSTMLMAGLEDKLPSTLKIKEGYDVFADELAKQTASGIEGMTQIGEKTVADRILPDGTPLKEYSCYFNDKNKLEYGLIIDFISRNGMLYIWYGFAGKEFYDKLNASFSGSLDTLTFSK